MISPNRRMLLAAAAALGASAAAAKDNEPIMGDRGATILGPRNPPRESQNPDILRPPLTDHGAMPNLRFSFADAHMKARDGGWSREITQRELEISKTIAGVNMRLKSGGVSELHWHKQAEWSFMLAGSARITAVDNDGHNFVADVGPGDLWYSRPGFRTRFRDCQPKAANSCWHFPMENFPKTAPSPSRICLLIPPGTFWQRTCQSRPTRFGKSPKEELFIFQADPPPPLQEDTVPDPQGSVPQNMVFKLMAQPPASSPGGRVRIADTRNFPISTEIAAAHVEVDPGHMREIHWHPNADEWQYYISGKARMTVFAAEARARTFDFQAGDVGYVPMSMSHFVENIGDEPLRFLELFKSPRYMDVSLAQWMALTPHELVQAHLKIDRGILDGLRKTKQPVV